MTMVQASPKARVLQVDDLPDDGRSWVSEINATGSFHITVRHPNEVSEKDLRDAQVVLVDMKLEEWPERDGLSAIALKPCNGLALLSVLQQQVRTLAPRTARAFAINTDFIGAVAEDLPRLPHLIARANNLDWVFDKTADPTRMRIARVSELANAVVALRSPWPKSEASEEVATAIRSWLALPLSASWATEAWRSLKACRPPLHSFAEHSNGIAVLRWMLHRILPYPCFLLDDLHVAARLRITSRSFRDALSHPSELATLLEPCRYEGALSAFGDRRWWRAGIESTIFDLTTSSPGSLTLLHKELQSVAPGLEVSRDRDLFPVLNESLFLSDDLATSDDVVRLHPDDWPSFADYAWARRTEVDKQPALSALLDTDEDAL